MQKWRPWETANEVEWGLAVERESVIRPLAEEERLTNGRLQEAMLRLGLSRSVLYKLVQRYRDRPQTSSLLPFGGRKFVLDLRAKSRTVRDLSDRKLLAIRKIRDLRAARQIPSCFNIARFQQRHQFLEFLFNGSVELLAVDRPCSRRRISFEHVFRVDANLPVLSGFPVVQDGVTHVLKEIVTCGIILPLEKSLFSDLALARRQRLWLKDGAQSGVPRGYLTIP